MDDSTSASPCQFVLSTLAVVTTQGETKTVPRKDCGAPSVTVDFVNGFRCEGHPPRWDQAYALYLRDMGWSDSAGAYRRTMIELLKDRILTRHQAPPEEEVA